MNSTKEDNASLIETERDDLFIRLDKESLMSADILSVVCSIVSFVFVLDLGIEIIPKITKIEQRAVERSITRFGSTVKLNLSPKIFNIRINVWKNLF